MHFRSNSLLLALLMGMPLIASAFSSTEPSAPAAHQESRRWDAPTPELPVNFTLELYKPGSREQLMMLHLSSAVGHPVTYSSTKKTAYLSGLMAALPGADLKEPQAVTDEIETGVHGEITPTKVDGGRVFLRLRLDYSMLDALETVELKDSKLKYQLPQISRAFQEQSLVVREGEQETLNFAGLTLKLTARSAD